MNHASLGERLLKSKNGVWKICRPQANHILSANGLMDVVGAAPPAVH
jgi:hypothetical protein